jgi:hypothetical protein
VLRIVRLGEFLYAVCANIIDRGRKQQGEKETPVPARIKKAARNEQKHVLALVGQRVIDQKNNWQKDYELE